MLRRAPLNYEQPHARPTVQRIHIRRLKGTDVVNPLTGAALSKGHYRQAVTLVLTTLVFLVEFRDVMVLKNLAMRAQSRSKECDKSVFDRIIVIGKMKLL